VAIHIKAFDPFHSQREPTSSDTKYLSKWLHMWRAVFGQIARGPWSEGMGVITRRFKFKTLAGISIYASVVLHIASTWVQPRKEGPCNEGK
jgi:hypothetical protein